MYQSHNNYKKLLDTKRRNKLCNQKLLINEITKVTKYRFSQKSIPNRTERHQYRYNTDFRYTAHHYLACMRVQFCCVLVALQLTSQRVMCRHQREKMAGRFALQKSTCACALLFPHSQAEHRFSSIFRYFNRKIDGIRHICMVTNSLVFAYAIIS